MRRLMGSLTSHRRGRRAADAATRAARASSTAFPSRAGCPTGSARTSSTTTSTEFTRTGFTAPLNWYRCFDRNWELTATTPAATIAVPSLFIGGAADPTLAYTPRHRVRDVVSGDYREVMIDGAGHWLQQERPAEVNADAARIPVQIGAGR